MTLEYAIDRADEAAKATGLQHSVVCKDHVNHKVVRITAGNWHTDAAYVVYASKEGR